MIPWHRWPWFVLWIAAMVTEALARWTRDEAEKRLKGEPDKPESS